MAKNSSQVLIKGMFLKSFLDYFKNAQGKEEAEKIGKKLGKISPYKSYPFEKMLDLINLMAFSFYGKNDDEALYQTGRFIIEAYFETHVGSILYKLVGNNLESFIKGTPNVAKLSHQGLEAECQKVREKEMKVIFRNFPYPPIYFKGVFDGGIEKFGFQPEVTWRNLSEMDIEYTLKWREK